MLKTTIHFAIFVAPSLTKTSSKLIAHVSVFPLKAHRYPTINSGDTIALRSAHSSYSSSWFTCHTNLCHWHSCQGTIITSSGWSSCDKAMMFTITAMGKTDGEPIYSGDTVSLSSNYFDSSYRRLYCTASSDTKCIINTYVHTAPVIISCNNIISLPTVMIRFSARGVYLLLAPQGRALIRDRALI